MLMFMHNQQTGNKGHWTVARNNRRVGKNRLNTGRVVTLISKHVVDIFFQLFFFAHFFKFLARQRPADLA